MRAVGDVGLNCDTGASSSSIVQHGAGLVVEDSRKVYFIANRELEFTGATPTFCCIVNCAVGDGAQEWQDIARRGYSSREPCPARARLSECRHIRGARLARPDTKSGSDPVNELSDSTNSQTELNSTQSRNLRRRGDSSYARKYTTTRETVHGRHAAT